MSASPNALIRYVRGLRAGSDDLTVSLSADALERIAQRAAELLEARLTAREPEPFLNLKQAAAYLACPESRIYSLVAARRMPVHRDGSRLLFRRSELDDYVGRGGAIRP